MSFLGRQRFTSIVTTHCLRLSIPCVIWYMPRFLRTHPCTFSLCQFCSVSFQVVNLIHGHDYTLSPLSHCESITEPGVGLWTPPKIDIYDRNYIRQNGFSAALKLHLLESKSYIGKGWPTPKRMWPVQTCLYKSAAE